MLSPLVSHEPARLGAVYTPDFLAEWTARRLMLSAVRQPARIVLDFACGQGALLHPFLESEEFRGTRLVGCDIDSESIALTRDAHPSLDLHSQSALGSPGDPPDSLLDALSIEPVDGIVLNPPWGISLDRDSRDLTESGFTLARGQFDSSDIFVEVALSLLSEGGVAGLILPDSLFFSDHENLRRLLLSRTILSITRLGEGIFPGVYRGCVVVFVRNDEAPAGHRVECGRLTPAVRKQVLTGTVRLEDAVRECSHEVSQSRFEEAPRARFDIDANSGDALALAAVSQFDVPWTDLLTTGRGIELSKHGRVLICPECGVARPLLRNIEAWTCECGSAHEAGSVEPTVITRRKSARPVRGWEPLIAGDDVNRYRCQASREIRSSIPGINYKSNVDRSRKRLLVRKTGVGIKAAVIETGDFTTQTVFHYQLGEEAPSYFLEYAAGVLNSRVMLSYHLKISGESEWRSHPYLTQRSIAELPVPVPPSGSSLERRAMDIAEMVGEVSLDRPLSPDHDLHLESLVAGIFGLGPEDMEWVNAVLHDSGEMEGITSLRLPPDSFVIPRRVA